jgi:hypothetical protein
VSERPSLPQSHRDQRRADLGDGFRKFAIAKVAGRRTRQRYIGILPYWRAYSWIPLSAICRAASHVTAVAA